MGMREKAIESLRKKAEKKMAPEVGNGNPDSDGMKAAPMAKSTKKKKQPDHYIQPADARFGNSYENDDAKFGGSYDDDDDAKFGDSYEDGEDAPGFDGSYVAPAAPAKKTKKKTKKKSTRAEISNPIYDKMNAERAKDRSDMRKADALKDKMHNKKKNLLKDAMKNK